MQPKIYGTDNSCTLDAVAQLGANGRGIAVVHPGIDDDELHRLHAGGIRGLRFSVWNPADTVTTIEMIEPLAPRVAELGWHVQLHISGDQVVTHADMLDRVAAPIVFDHIGRLPPALGTGHAAFAVIRRLLDKGRAWMKLSGAYLNSLVGPPAYADATLWRRPLRGSPRSGWCGAAIGLTSPKCTSLTTPCCSIFSPIGRRTQA